ncbi:hypothetical protein CANCADRAFT_103717 [Tortispora caseinolytica NRRL Y-17796]|uniref:Uncharacterized protein n=1 Tax=Tortispora caseinolytica NRRL Y-17796 TaxID=767744 RepID=A0A1E4TEM8_9ASCO|nr:hypothetical protein CANCADRAFT_103717 [Tortispora caseinolytica NRRL Y-17796]
MSTQAVITQVRNAAGAADYANCFELDFSKDVIATVQTDAQTVDIDTAVAAAGLSPAMELVLKAYLQLCRDVNPYDVRQTFDLVEKLAAATQTAFASSQGAVLYGLVVHVIGVALPLAAEADRLDRVEKRLPPKTVYAPRNMQLSGTILRLFNSIRGDRDPHSPRKSILLYIAVALCKTYFALEQPISCANVFANMHTAAVKMSQYPMSLQVFYRCQLGRFYFYRNQYLLARRHLLWAYTHCNGTSPHNERVIMLHLVPASIVLGYMPTRQLLQTYNLDALYGPAVAAIKQGDRSAYYSHIEKTKLQLISVKVYSTMRYRMDTLLLRNLFRRVMLIQQVTDLRFSDLLKAIEFSSRDLATDPVVAEWDYNAIESIVVSLIDQGYMKGNVYTRNQLVRLYKQMPFVDVTHVWQHESTVADESWMEQ